jgi:hypothetical protein
MFFGVELMLSEAISLNNAVSPSCLAALRLLCQPILKGRPVASQTRHSHSVGLPPHSVMTTFNMTEFYER